MQPLLLSKSRLNTYCQCPEKFRLTYVEKIIPDKTPIPLVEGSALHHIVGNCLVYGKKVPDLAAEVSREFWQNHHWQKTAYPDESAFQKAQENILQEATDFVEKIGELKTHEMETYFEHPLVHPVSGEVDESIILRGYADIIDTDPNGMTRVIDIKTTARTPNTEQANRAMELTVYAYLVACTFGFHIELPVSLLYLVRSKQPKVIWLHSERRMPDFLKLHENIVSISHAIRQGLFWKNQGMHCTWCVHQDICFAGCMAA